MMKWQDIQEVLEGRNNRRSDAGAITGVFLTGAAIGVVAGMLLAPRSGKETRDKLKQGVKTGIDTTKDKANDAKDSAKASVGQAAEVAKRTVAEGKRATREVKRRSGGSNESEEEE
jgi:gas vesicle protein